VTSTDSFRMDLTKISEFHPRVIKVDLLSGKTSLSPPPTMVITETDFGAENVMS
jgi:hypothetical protein